MNNRKENVMYQKPTITKIGSYRTLTNGAGTARDWLSCVDCYSLAMVVIEKYR